MSARGWGLFAAVSVIWGMPYLFIKIAVDDGILAGSWLSTDGRLPPGVAAVAGRLRRPGRAPELGAVEELRVV